MTTVKAKAIITAIALIAVTIPFAAHAKVETTAAAVDFNRYQTYAWNQPAEDLNPAQRQIRDAVDVQLAAHGLQEVVSGADLAASLETQIRNETRVDSHPPMTHRPRFDRWMRFHGLEVVEIREVTEGQFDIRLIDADEGSEVWQGTATGTPRSKPEKNAAKIEKATAKMFRNFPNGK